MFAMTSQPLSSRFHRHHTRPCPGLVGKVAPPALPDAEWTTWTWQEYYDESCQIAKALMAVGMEQHSSANIFGFNSPEWFMAEMGAIIAGGKAAGIYPTDTAEQIAFKAAHSGASVAFLEDESKLAKFTIAAKSLPELKAIVCWVRAHTYIHTYTHTHIHIYIYTHARCSFISVSTSLLLLLPTQPPLSPFFS